MPSSKARRARRALAAATRDAQRRQAAEAERQETWAQWQAWTRAEAPDALAVKIDGLTRELHDLWAKTRQGRREVYAIRPDLEEDLSKAEGPVWRHVHRPRLDGRGGMVA